MSKLDTLFAAKAVSKEINRRVRALEEECKSDFVEEYRRNGTDRMRSAVFGKEAGWLTMKDGRPSEHVTVFQMVDEREVIEWMDEARPETDGFATDNLAQFCQWWFEHTGECPDGCTVISYDTEPTEPTPVLVVKEAKVLPKLKGNALAGEVNQLLLGEADA